MPRARTIEEFRTLMAQMLSPESVGKGLALTLRPTDVVITPFAKSGTTWLQQMVHTLRTGGDLDFDDISRVVPWIETSTALGIDLDAEQKANPRAFKSHLPYEPIPKGGKYIVAVRDPVRVLISFTRFMDGWFLKRGAVGVDQFADHFLDRSEGRDYWTHFLSWWPRRTDDGVLLIAFEHMKREPRSHVERVARFIGVDVDDELIDLALERSSLACMLEHKEKFDDKLMRELSERVLGVGAGAESSKVHAEDTAGASSPSQRTLDRLKARWDETLGEEFGLKDYDAVLAVLSKEELDV